MDRSYPYSRRLMARARLRRRLAAVAAAALTAAAAGYMLTRPADPIASSLAPTAALPALHGDAGAPPQSGVRRIYPYSIIPGGVAGAIELARAVRTDRVVAEHYATFDITKARPVTVERPRAVHVSYRKGGKVYWTARKVMLAPGETLLTDGRNEMRARCANRISDLPQYPVEAHQPAMGELDHPVDIEEGLAADGLAVSSAGADDIPTLTGQAGRVAGGFGAAGGGTAGVARTDAMRSGSSAPGIGGSSLMTMGQSGSSSSLGSRPRPAGRPAASTDGGSNTDTTSGSSGGNDGKGGSGGSGGSSSSAQPPADERSDPAQTPSPAPAGSTPAPGADANQPPAPQTTPAVQPDSAAGPVPSPAPQPGVPTIPGTPLPSTPLPGPLPLPGTTVGNGPTPTQPGTDTPLFPLPQPAPLPLPGGAGLPPVLQPGGVITPGGKETPAWTPPQGPLPGTPSVPVLDADPFIPAPGLEPPPLQAVLEPAAPPAKVPEPGSLWLAAIALAALCRLRRA